MKSLLDVGVDLDIMPALWLRMVVVQFFWCCHVLSNAKHSLTGVLREA